MVFVELRFKIIPAIFYGINNEKNWNGKFGVSEKYCGLRTRIG